MQREYCIKIFKLVLEQYKKDKEPPTKESKLSETYTPDYLIFQKLQKTFMQLERLVKYVVVKNKEYYSKLLQDYNLEEEDVYELDKMSINIPKNLDELVNLYATYPNAIDTINDELFEIINMENYPALIMLRKINILLYYSVISDEKEAEKILFFEDSVNEFADIVKSLIKKLLREHVEMLVQKK